MARAAAERRGWAAGFADEVWFSRLAQPALSAWSARDAPVRMRQKERPAGDTAPKALACYGLYLPDAPSPGRQMRLRFVSGRPVSAVTCAFLSWLAAELPREGIRVLVLFWDNASWHVSREVRQWVRAHNRRAKREGGLRLLVCPLPKRSPWLNNIEPKWVHGKRAVAEPERVLPPEELVSRLCRYYRCDNLERIKR